MIKWSFVLSFVLFISTTQALACGVLPADPDVAKEKAAFIGVLEVVGIAPSSLLKAEEETDDEDKRRIYGSLYGYTPITVRPIIAYKGNLSEKAVIRSMNNNCYHARPNVGDIIERTVYLDDDGNYYFSTHYAQKAISGWEEYRKSADVYNELDVYKPCPEKHKYKLSSNSELKCEKSGF